VLVTTEAQQVDAKMTAQTFAGLPYDSSFAASYFPDVVINDPSLGGDIKVPPTVAVLGAFANNDRLAHSWFAPAGFTRGAIDISSAATTFSVADLDVLYESKINPITSFPGSEFVVWGQKTLLKSASSLDRVNVRRLLIYIRRTVRAIALGFLFEPNRAETLEKFSAQINPFLQGIMDNQGLDRFKVKIDTETTTQIDVENNTLRGKIYVQPAKTAEFISIDFVVSNTL
jgi:phage tail sheath protein FI